MGAMDRLSQFTDAIKKGVEVVDTIATAVPKMQQAAGRLKKGFDEVLAAAQDAHQAAAPVVRSVSPYPQEVLEAAKVLNVTVPLSKVQLETAFKAAVRAAHPDRGGNHDEMKSVNAARVTLTPWCREG
jgi:hypothetical protein